MLPNYPLAPRPPVPPTRYHPRAPLPRSVDPTAGYIDRTVRARRVAGRSNVAETSFKCGNGIVVLDGSRLFGELRPGAIATGDDWPVFATVAGRILAVTADAGRAIVERDLVDREGVVSDGVLELNVRSPRRGVPARWDGTLVGPKYTLTKRGSTIGAAYAANGVVVVLSATNDEGPARFVVESFVTGRSTSVWKSPPGYADASLSRDGRHVVAVAVAEPPVAVVWTVGTFAERRFELDPLSTVRGARVAGDSVFVYDELGVRVYGPAWPNPDVVRDVCRRRVVPSPDGTRFVELIFDEFYGNVRETYAFGRVHRSGLAPSYLELADWGNGVTAVVEFSPDNETFTVLSNTRECAVYAFGTERLVAAMRASAVGRSVPAEVLASIEAFADSAPPDFHWDDDPPAPPAFRWPEPPEPVYVPPPAPEEPIGRRGAVSSLGRLFRGLGRRPNAPVARLAMGPEDETDG